MFGTPGDALEALAALFKRGRSLLAASAPEQDLPAGSIHLPSVVLTSDLGTRERAREDVGAPSADVEAARGLF